MEKEQEKTGRNKEQDPVWTRGNCHGGNGFELAHTTLLFPTEVFLHVSLYSVFTVAVDVPCLSYIPPYFTVPNQ